MNNLRQVGLSVLNFEQATGKLPNGAPSPFSTGRGPTWVTQILPYIEEQAVYDSFDLTRQLSDPVNRTAVTSVIESLVCPSDPTSSNPLQGGANCRIQRWNSCEAMGLWYPASMGPTRDGTSAGNSCIYCVEPYPSWCCEGHDYGRGGIKTFAGLFGQTTESVELRMVTDGLSKTFLAGESIPSHCSFNGAYSTNFPIAGTSIPLNTREINNPNVDDKWYSACGYKSEHPGGVNFVYADNHIAFLQDTIDYFIYNAMGSRDGAEGDSPPPSKRPPVR